MPWQKESNSMSERIDRRIKSARTTLVVFVLLIGFAAGGGAYLWRLLEPMAPERAALPAGGPTPIPVPRPEDSLVVTLYYPLDDALRPGAAGIKRLGDVQTQAREAMTALIAESHRRHAPVLKDLKLRSFFLDAAGTAYVDLALIQARQQAPRASVWEELLAVYAIVNTVMSNFEDIKQVRILMDGKEAPTLAGHIDLSRPYTARMGLVRR